MTPLYFPFTRIPADQLSALSLWFSKIALYRSSTQKGPEEKNKALEIRAPFPEDETRFDSLYKDYQEWGRLHGQKDLSLFKTIRPDEIHPWSDATSSQIRNILKRYTEPKTASTGEILLQARIFLQLAWEFDRQQEASDRDMGRAESMEMAMFRGLLGTMDTDKARPANDQYPLSLAPDPGMHLTAERLAAWSCLLNHDQTDHGLFITGSRFVGNHMLETAPDMRQIAKFISIPANVKDAAATPNPCSLVTEAISRLSRIPSDSPMEQVSVPCLNKDIGLQMDLFRVSGLSPKHFFQKFIGPYSETIGFGKGGSAFSETLIGIISTERIY